MVKEDVGNMEPNVMGASYTEDASLVARRRLSGLNLKGSLRNYVKEFIEIMWDIQEMDEKEKLNAFLDGLPREATQELQLSGVRSFSELVSIARH